MNSKKHVNGINSKKKNYFTKQYSTDSMWSAVDRMNVDIDLDRC